jgi:hypothetical protein
MLTRTFLLETDVDPESQSKLNRAVEAHQASFTSLKKNLQEANTEWMLDARMRKATDDYEAAVDTLNKLAQHLGGLRSGTRLQLDLCRAYSKGNLAREVGNAGFVPTSVEPAAGDGKSKRPSTPVSEDAYLAATASVFGDLIADLGPPLKALSVRDRLIHCGSSFVTELCRPYVWTP